MRAVNNYYVFWKNKYDMIIDKSSSRMGTYLIKVLSMYNCTYIVAMYLKDGNFSPTLSIILGQVCYSHLLKEKKIFSDLGTK